MKVRVACAHLVASVLRGEASLNSLLPRFLPRVVERDRGLLQELAYGTLRHYPALAALLERLLDKPLRDKDAEITALLAAALYQIRHLDTPGHAAVNEAVSACRDLKRPWARGMVNGVLRRFLREQDTLEAACAGNARYRTAHPDWLREALCEAWPNECEAIMAANNRRPPFALRVNALRLDRETCLARLAAADIAARAAPLAPEGIYLDDPVPVESLPGFAAGELSVQDEAAQLCAGLLAPRAGDRILDACCAPGGKTGHLLESRPGPGELVALDSDAGRLERVAENLQRLGLEATLKAADATDLEAWWDGEPFERILLDAPCSATGVIRRHPDIKLLRRPGDIAKLAVVQGQLLARLWRTLAPGGRLLYATCSVLSEENDAVVGAFAENRADCRILPLDAHGGLETACGRQLFPRPEGHDGFYYALLEKTADG